MLCSTFFFLIWMELLPSQTGQEIMAILRTFLFIICCRVHARPVGWSMTLLVRHLQVFLHNCSCPNALSFSSLPWTYRFSTAVENPSFSMPHCVCLFVSISGARTHIYKRLCPSVGRWNSHKMFEITQKLISFITHTCHHYIHSHIQPCLDLIEFGIGLKVRDQVGA